MVLNFNNIFTPRENNTLVDNSSYISDNIKKRIVLTQFKKCLINVIYVFFGYKCND